MKILLAYDGFEYSKHALEEAAKLAAEDASTVTIVGVVPLTARGTKTGGHGGLPPHAEEDHHGRPFWCRARSEGRRRRLSPSRRPQRLASPPLRARASSTRNRRMQAGSSWDHPFVNAEHGSSEPRRADPLEQDPGGEQRAPPTIMYAIVVQSTSMSASFAVTVA